MCCVLTQPVLVGHASVVLVERLALFGSGQLAARDAYSGLLSALCDSLDTAIKLVLGLRVGGGGHGDRVVVVTGEAGDEDLLVVVLRRG